MHPAGSNTLDGVKLPWQKADDSTSEAAESAAADTVDETAADPTAKPAQTAGKGRPTPSRREAQGRKRGGQVKGDTRPLGPDDDSKIAV